KLGVLLPGLGAVATTTIAGVLLARRGHGLPIGSLTQMGSVRRSYGEAVPIREFVPLAELEDLVFRAWDVFPENAFEWAMHAKALEPRHLELVKEELSAIRPMHGAFYPEYVKRLNGTHVKTASTKAEMVEQLREDIRRFKAESGCDRLVAVWCAS